jgi:hypothetical protein
MSSYFFKLACGLIIFVAAFAMGTGPAMSEADDPIDTPEEYYFNAEGSPRDSGGVNFDEWTCVQKVSRFTCYESVLAAESAEGFVRAPQCSGMPSPLRLATRQDFGGHNNLIDRIKRWVNLGSKMNNDVSSFSTGEWNSHLAENRNGNGYWFPGDSSRCNVERDMGGTGWNNRVSSIKRYPPGPTEG